MKGKLTDAIREHVMRINMIRLYASMTKSTHNTDLISSGRLVGITKEDVGGNSDIKERMMGLSRWLEELQIGSTERDFENAFMNPMRNVARFRDYMHHRTPASTDIDGYVFAVSDPYDDGIVDEDMCTVSAIVPCLQNAMHIRVKDAGTTLGWKTFRNVQPMPLVNRLYPTRLEIIASERRPDMDGMGFLKCPLSKAKYFERSLAMENFCEIGSSQTEKKPRLGAPVIVSGLVTKITPYRITVNGCDSSRSQMIASLSSELGTRFKQNRLGDLENAWVRMLVVVWYWSKEDSDEDRPFPELYMIEKTAEEHAVVDDVVGYVRVFGSVRTEDLDHTYKHVPEHLPLELTEDGVFRYAYKNSSVDAVCRKFVNTVDTIRAMRFETGSPNIHCMPDEVLDDQITEKHVLSRLKRYSDMRLVLLRIIQGGERGCGSTVNEIRELLPHVKDDLFSYYVWLLKRQFVLKGDDGILRATRSGKIYGYATMRDDVGKFVMSWLKPAVFLPDLRDTEIPASFVMKYLEEIAYSPIVIDGHPCKTAWCKPDASRDDADACVAKVADMRESVLGIFYSSYHSITSEYISCELRTNGLNVSTVYVDALLLLMEKTGEVDRDGGSWCVSMENRIRRTIARSTADISKDEVMTISYVARKDKDKVDDILEALRSDGTVSLLPNGNWISSESLEQWQIQAVNVEAKNCAVSLLSRRCSGMSEDIFMERMKYHIRSTVPGFDWRQHLESVVKQLIDGGVIELDDGMFRFVKRSSGS